jgi:Tol biopolymer transport system component
LTDDGYLEADPAWSPDGRFVAYSSDRAGSMDLYVRDMGTGSTRRLTSTPGAEAAASWSPDGARIAFVSRRDGNFEVYAMDADGINQVRLTTHPAFDIEPAWQAIRLVPKPSKPVRITP